MNKPKPMKNWKTLDELIENVELVTFKEFDTQPPREKISQAKLELKSYVQNLLTSQHQEREINSDNIKSFISTLLKQQREEWRIKLIEQHEQVNLVIKSWCGDFINDMESGQDGKTYKVLDVLHPVDVLEKYVFPHFENQKEKIREEIVGGIKDKIRKDPLKSFKNRIKYASDLGYNQALTDIIKTIKDL